MEVHDVSPGVQLQMGALGPQDVFLTQNPEKTFFDHSWKRHVSFATTPTSIYFPRVVFSGERSSVIIPKSGGDVLESMTLEIRLPPGVTTRSELENRSFLRRARLVIDDMVVQDREALWGDILDHVVHRKRREILDHPTNVLYIPLRFVRQLPLVAMYNSTIQVDVELHNPLPHVSSEDIEVALVCNFVDLDASQQAVFRAQEHLLVYGDAQDMDDVSYTVTDEGRRAKKHVRIDMAECNRPVNFMALVAYQEDDTTFQYLNPFESIAFLCGGEDIFQPRPQEYFSGVQQYQHCVSCVGSEHIFVYSFGLDVNIWKEGGHHVNAQPSGSLNFAAVRSPHMLLTFKEPALDVKCKVFVSTLNWLRVANGFAAPLFT